MKLELKYLAPYLPYGVKWIKRGEHYNTALMSTKNIALIRQDGFCDLWKCKWENIPKDCKPILRLLSDAIEEIKKEFIKYDNGKEYDNEVIEFFNSDLIGDIEEIDKLKIDYLPYGAIKWLIKNRYDTNNLIPEGLAIDVNTLWHETNR